MAGNIIVSTGELRKAKERIVALNDDLYKDLSTAKATVKGLDTYKGEASKKLMDNIESMEKAFKAYKDKVQKIIDWLEKTAESDTSTETTEIQNAEKTPVGDKYNFPT